MSNSNAISNKFTKQELEVIESSFRPLGNTTAKKILDSNELNSLSYLPGHLYKEDIRHLAYRILEHADTLINKTTPIIDLHFYYHSRGKYYYRWRNHDKNALQEAIKSFKCQIRIAKDAAKIFQNSEHWGFMPAHSGYNQLRIIEEKRGNYIEAKKICLMAKSEGWNDDWNKHIERIDKKITKTKD